MKRRKPRQISRKQASDNRILAKIKAEMTPICVMCGKWCVPDLMHLLPSIEELKGKDLACFCSLSSPCHVDAILKRVGSACAQRNASMSSATLEH